MELKTRIQKSTVTALQKLLTELQGIACSMGFVFAFVGAFFFVFSIYLLIRQPEQAPKIAEVFRMSCAFLMTAWLLLRFASGLWPFGRRFFQ